MLFNVLLTYQGNRNEAKTFSAYLLFRWFVGCYLAVFRLYEEYFGINSASGQCATNANVAQSFAANWFRKGPSVHTEWSIHVFFSRKDGKPLDKDDASYLRTNAPQVVDWVTTDEGKKVIGGTNFNLEEGNLNLLKKRFVAEDYSGK